MIIDVLCHKGRAQKTVQYGFNLQEAVDNYGKRKTDWQAINADLYACGFLPPNHPLPVIPLLAYANLAPRLQFRARLFLYLDLTRWH